VIVLPAWKEVKDAPRYKKQFDHKKNAKIFFGLVLPSLLTWGTVLVFTAPAAVATIAALNAKSPRKVVPNSQNDVQTCQHCSILTLVNPPNDYDIILKTRCWTSCYTAWDYLKDTDPSSVLVLDNTGEIEARASGNPFKTTSPLDNLHAVIGLFHPREGEIELTDNDSWKAWTSSDGRSKRSMRADGAFW
jgi:hypothetical protein